MNTPNETNSQSEDIDPWFEIDALTSEIRKLEWYDPESALLPVLKRQIDSLFQAVK